jgi:hypothetical protein
MFRDCFAFLAKVARCSGRLTASEVRTCRRASASPRSRASRAQIVGSGVGEPQLQVANVANHVLAQIVEQLARHARLLSVRNDASSNRRANVRRREALRVAALVHGVLRLAARRRVRVNDQIDVSLPARATSPT